MVSGTFADGTNEAIRRWLGGIQVGYVFSYATAAPFTRPTSAPTRIAMPIAGHGP